MSFRHNSLGSQSRMRGEELLRNDDLQTMLRPYYGKPMKAIKIGSRVGYVKYDEASLIKPANG